MSVSSWSLMFNWCWASLCSTFSNLTNLNHIICQIFQSWNCKKESTKPKIIAIFERVAEILLYKLENFNSHFTLLHCYRENRRTSICGKINFGVDTFYVLMWKALRENWLILASLPHQTWVWSKYQILLLGRRGKRLMLETLYIFEMCKIHTTRNVDLSRVKSPLYFFCSSSWHSPDNDWGPRHVNVSDNLEVEIMITNDKCHY